MSTSALQIALSFTGPLGKAERFVYQAEKEKTPVAVLIVNVNNVEQLCASLGHATASDLLLLFYSELKKALRPTDCTHRVSDRKTVVVLHGVRNRGHVRLAAEKLESILRKEVLSDLAPGQLSVSIGCAFSMDHGHDLGLLLKYCELAAIENLDKKDSVAFYEPSAAEELYSRWGLEDRLRRSIKEGGLFLLYQPKVCLRRFAVVGTEALMRWHEPEIGPVSPDVFVEVAERSGQIHELTQFAVQNACREASNWKKRGVDIGVAVNVAPTVLASDELFEAIRSALKIWSVSAQSLTIEVTETAIMTDVTAGQENLDRIRGLGARISIDDFGTGYSSLAKLKDIPADELKIDKSFVLGMQESSVDRKIVEHAVGIARSFGFESVAEGIESEGAIRVLQSMGCDLVQGFHLSPPVAAEEIPAVCREMQRRNR